jgi:hypothetical protein
MTVYTQFPYSISSSRDGLLEIYDVRGRVVRKSVVILDGQRGIMTWNGRDDRGERVPAGVYFLRLRGGGTVRQLRVTVLR